jgi:hypothetical protein
VLDEISNRCRAIFDEIHKVNQEADANETMLRISLDAKAPAKLGFFSRGGLNRVVVNTLDHDFHCKTPRVTSFGISLSHFFLLSIT